MERDPFRNHDGANELEIHDRNDGDGVHIMVREGRDHRHDLSGPRKKELMKWLADGEQKPDGAYYELERVVYHMGYTSPESMARRIADAYDALASMCEEHGVHPQTKADVTLREIDRELISRGVSHGSVQERVETLAQDMQRTWGKLRGLATLLEVPPGESAEKAIDLAYERLKPRIVPSIEEMSTGWIELDGLVMRHVDSGCIAVINPPSDRLQRHFSVVLTPKGWSKRYPLPQTATTYNAKGWLLAEINKDIKAWQGVIDEAEGQEPLLEGLKSSAAAVAEVLGYAADADPVMVLDQSLLAITQAKIVSDTLCNAGWTAFRLVKTVREVDESLNRAGVEGYGSTKDRVDALIAAEAKARHDLAKSEAHVAQWKKRCFFLNDHATRLAAELDRKCLPIPNGETEAEKLARVEAERDTAIQGRDKLLERLAELGKMWEALAKAAYGVKEGMVLTPTTFQQTLDRVRDLADEAAGQEPPELLKAMEAKRQDVERVVTNGAREYEAQNMEDDGQEVERVVRTKAPLHLLTESWDPRSPNEVYTSKAGDKVSVAALVDVVFGLGFDAGFKQRVLHGEPVEYSPAERLDSLERVLDRVANELHGLRKSNAEVLEKLKDGDQEPTLQRRTMEEWRRRALAAELDLEILHRQHGQAIQLGGHVEPLPADHDPVRAASERIADLAVGYELAADLEKTGPASTPQTRLAVGDWALDKKTNDGKVVITEVGSDGWISYRSRVLDEDTGKDCWPTVSVHSSNVEFLAPADELSLRVVGITDPDDFLPEDAPDGEGLTF